MFFSSCNFWLRSKNWSRISDFNFFPFIEVKSLKSFFPDNFSKLSRALARWGKLLFDAGELTAAKKVLSYAISCKADIEEAFITLEKIYRQEDNELGISDLVEACDCFDELRKNNIINQIASV